MITKRPYSTRIPQDLGSSVISYSPDLTSRDFHLFCSLQNALNDKIFSQDQVKTFMENLSLKSAEFYKRGINKLPDKWQAVILNNEMNSLLNYS